MAFVHLGAVNHGSARAGLDRAALRAKTHGAAQIGLLAAPFDAALAVHPFGDQRYHRVRRLGVEFGAVGAVETGHMARELDGRELHAEADTEVGHLVLARVADRHNLALGAATAEAAGNQDCIHAL